MGIYSKQAFKYVIAGGCGTILQYTLYFTLVHFFGVFYLTSAAAAGTVKGVTDFLLQKLWTFNRRELQDTHKQAGAYFILGTSLFISNMLLLFLFVDIVGANYVWGQVLSTIILTIVGYYATRWIFRKSPHK